MVQRRPGFKETVMPMHIDGGRHVSAFSSIFKWIFSSLYVCLWSLFVLVYSTVQPKPKIYTSEVCEEKKNYYE